MIVETFNRHRPTVLLVVYSLLALLFLTLRVGPYVSGLKASLWFLLSPPFVYSGQFFNKLDVLGGRLFELMRVEGENQILREQNAQLSKKELERDELEKENGRLRSLLELKQYSFPQGIAAEIVAQDTREFFNAVVVNKGSLHHILPSAAVVATHAGALSLVGRVLETGEHTSKILLLTDSLSAISVSIARTNEIGLLEGRNKPWVVVKYLPRDSSVQPGDAVQTVGLGGFFPSGIPVGIVQEAFLSEDGFFKEAKLTPYVVMGSLRDVLVLKRVEGIVDNP